MRTGYSHFLSLFFAVGLTLPALHAQQVTEVQQELSKKARKGFVDEIKVDETGQVNVIYKIPGDKKKDDNYFEQYSFSSAGTFTGSQIVTVPKKELPDKTVVYFYSEVGGCNSFDVLSMKLKLVRKEILREWSDASQRYEYKKTISSETVKPKNDNGKNYTGLASFTGYTDDGQESFNLVKVKGEKKEPDAYYVLMLNKNLEIREIPIQLNGPHTLVFAAQFDDNNDIVTVFAPGKGAADLTQYTYIHFAENGSVKNKIEFKSPAAAMLITSAFMRNGSVIFCGNSIEGKKSFSEVFEEYAPINNPCYTGAANYQDFQWMKSSEKEMDFFHFLRFTGDKLDFSTSASVKSFKEKFKTSATDKGADPYQGKKLYIDQFYVTPEGEYIVAGQLTGMVHVGNGNMAKYFGDVVCFHFNTKGELRAQYGLKKMNNDKKSEVFAMPQKFILSQDGSKLYWQVMEVKGTTGYASFMDAYNGSKSFYANYFPRLVTIDLKAANVSESKVLGNEKFFVRGRGRGIWDEKTRTMTYVGHDEDYEKVWVAKAVLK